MKLSLAFSFDFLPFKPYQLFQVKGRGLDSDLCCAGAHIKPKIEKSSTRTMSRDSQRSDSPFFPSLEKNL